MGPSGTRSEPAGGIDLKRVINSLPEIRKAAENASQTLLSNLVMIGEVPSPTFGEQRRIQFLAQRLTDAGLGVSQDEAGNGVGVLAGSEGHRNILIVAHADTPFGQKDDHTITVEEERVLGPGVADNSLGLAALAMLPILLDRAGIRFRSNLVLLGSTRSLGRGDLGGLRFFMENAHTPFCGAVCVEGVQLGRLSYSSIGMLRGEFRVSVPEEYDWSGFGATGAIRIVNEVINRLLSTPLPSQPRTSIRLGSIRGGTGFANIATQAELRFEIRSESEKIVTQLHERVDEIAAELSAETNTDVTLEIFARRAPGGIQFSHPLVRAARTVMEELEIEPRLSPSISELAVLIQEQVPAVTLGLSTGGQLQKMNEFAHIKPMSKGLAQLVGVLMAMDEGLCHES